VSKSSATQLLEACEIRGYAKPSSPPPQTRNLNGYKHLQPPAAGSAYSPLGSGLGQYTPGPEIYSADYSPMSAGMTAPALSAISDSRTVADLPNTSAQERKVTCIWDDSPNSLILLSVYNSLLRVYLAIPSEK
jgi:hypothetical protein